MRSMTKVISVIAVLMMIGTAFACMATPISATNSAPVVKSERTVHLDPDYDADNPSILDGLSVLYGREFTAAEASKIWYKQGEVRMFIMEGVNFRCTSATCAIMFEDYSGAEDTAFTLVVKGENTVTLCPTKEGTKQMYWGSAVIFSDEDIRITGGGTLNIVNEKEASNNSTACLYCYDDIYVNDVTINCRSSHISVTPDMIMPWMNAVGDSDDDTNSSLPQMEERYYYCNVSGIYSGDELIISDAVVNVNLGSVDYTVECYQETYEGWMFGLRYSGIFASSHVGITKDSLVYSKTGDVNVYVENNTDEKPNVNVINAGINTYKVSDDGGQSSLESYVYGIAGNIYTHHDKNVVVGAYSAGIYITYAYINYGMHIVARGGIAQGVSNSSNVLSGSFGFYLYEYCTLRNTTIDAKASYAYNDSLLAIQMNSYSCGFVIFDDDYDSSSFYNCVINTYAEGDAKSYVYGFYSYGYIYIDGYVNIVCKAVGTDSCGFGLHSNGHANISIYSSSAKFYLISEGDLAFDTNTGTSNILSYMRSASMTYYATIGGKTTEHTTYSSINTSAITYFAMTDGSPSGSMITDGDGTTTLWNYDESGKLPEPTYVPEGKKFLYWLVTDVTNKSVKMQPGETVVLEESNALTAGPLKITAVLGDKNTSSSSDNTLVMIVAVILIVVVAAAVAAAYYIQRYRY